MCEKWEKEWSKSTRIFCMWDSTALRTVDVEVRQEGRGLGTTITAEDKTKTGQNRFGPRWPKI